MKNEKMFVFSGESMVGDARHFLQVCKNDKKVAHNPVQRGVSPLEGLAKEWEIRGAMPPMLSWVQQAPSVVLSNSDVQYRVIEASSSSVRDDVIVSSSLCSPEPENLWSPDD
jgi:hypothetical protein